MISDLVTEYEKELKISLTEDDYNKLITKYQNEIKTVIQTNYYFDTDDLSLAEKSTTVRIREKNEKYQFTIKTEAQARVGERYDRVEYNIDIMESEFCKLLDGYGLDKYTENLISSPLIFVGKMMTTRSKLIIAIGAEIEIDKNEFLGIVDYELEFEYKTEENLEFLKIFLYDNNIKNLKSASKYERFIQRKKDI